MAQFVLSVNAKAVSLFREQQRYKEAAMTLQLGLSLLEKEYECSQLFDLQNTQREVYLSDMGITFQASQNEHKQEEQQDSYTVYDNLMDLVVTTPPEEEEEEEEEALHARLMMTRSLPLSCLSEQDYGVLYAVLLYNYGLCMQMHGLKTGGASERASCQCALVAYETAVGLLNLAAEPHDLNTFCLELALLNNVGHIQHHFHNTRQTIDCLRCMHRVLHNATGSWSIRIPPALTFFAHNIIFNGYQYTRPAAAA